MRSLKILLLSVATFTTLSASSDNLHGMGDPAPSGVGGAETAAALGGENVSGALVRAVTPEDAGDTAAHTSTTNPHESAFAVMQDTVSGIGRARDILEALFGETDEADEKGNAVREALRILAIVSGNLSDVINEAQSGCPAFAAAAARDRSSSQEGEDNAAVTAAASAANDVGGSRDVHVGSKEATPVSPAGNNTQNFPSAGLAAAAASGGTTVSASSSDDDNDHEAIDDGNGDVPVAGGASAAAAAESGSNDDDGNSNQEDRDGSDEEKGNDDEKDGNTGGI